MLSFLYRTFLVAMVADCGTLAKCLGKPRLVFFLSHSDGHAKAVSRFF